MYVSITHAMIWPFGADVGRGDVVLGADVGAERVDEAARDALQLVARELARVELDAAFAAAERDVISAHFHVIIAASALTSSSVTLLVVAHAALVRARAGCCAGCGSP